MKDVASGSAENKVSCFDHVSEDVYVILVFVSYLSISMRCLWALLLADLLSEMSGEAWLLLLGWSTVLLWSLDYASLQAQ